MPNKNYRIKLLKVAEDDFTEIVMYISAENINAANKLADKIEKSLLSLTENPKLGRIPRDEDIKQLGYRYLIVENYIIFYTIDQRTIYIHRILHGSRNYKTIL